MCGDYNLVYLALEGDLGDLAAETALPELKLFGVAGDLALLPLGLAAGKVLVVFGEALGDLPASFLVSTDMALIGLVFGLLAGEVGAAAAGDLLGDACETDKAALDVYVAISTGLHVFCEQ